MVKNSNPIGKTLAISIDVDVRIDRINSRIFRAGDIHFYDEVAVYDFIRFIPMLPNMSAWVNLVFGVLLGIYIWLLFNGPGLDTENGLFIQVTGQQIIAA